MSPDTRRELWVPIGVTAGLGVAACAVALRDPHVSGAWGFCPFFALTGLYCPFCGGLRGTYDLMHGDVAASFAQFPFLLPLLAWMAFLIGAWALAIVRARPITRWVWISGVLLAIPWAAWALLRNLG